jgi:hypothetical protein
MANWLDPAKNSNQATGSTESCPPTKAWPGQLGVCPLSSGTAGEKFAAQSGRCYVGLASMEWSGVARLGLLATSHHYDPSVRRLEL